jgi:hypothetical protein
MNKSVALQELNKLVDEILFGSGRWPPDPGPVCSRLSEMGLTEKLARDPQSSMYTELGKTVQVDIFEVFLGVYDEAEIPFILEQFGLFRRAESEWLWDRLEAGENVWPWMRVRLRRAYREYFGQEREN